MKNNRSTLFPHKISEGSKIVKKKRNVVPARPLIGRKK